MRGAPLNVDETSQARLAFRRPPDLHADYGYPKTTDDCNNAEDETRQYKTAVQAYRHLAVLLNMSTGDEPVFQVLMDHDSQLVLGRIKLPIEGGRSLCAQLLSHPPSSLVIAEAALAVTSSYANSKW